jgi:hypothetical protein
VGAGAAGRTPGYFGGRRARSGREEGGAAGTLEGFPHGDVAEAGLGRGIGLAGERVGDQVARARWEAAAEVGDGEDLPDVAGQFGVEIVEVLQDEGPPERVGAGGDGGGGALDQLQPDLPA